MKSSGSPESMFCWGGTPFSRFFQAKLIPAFTWKTKVPRKLLVTTWQLAGGEWLNPQGPEGQRVGLPLEKVESGQWPTWNALLNYQPLLIFTNKRPQYSLEVKWVKMHQRTCALGPSWLSQAWVPCTADSVAVHPPGWAHSLWPRATLSPSSQGIGCLLFLWSVQK